MSRARHKARKHAKGGSVHKSEGPFVYAGGGSNVMEDAHERKRGGRIHAHGEGEEAHERHDRRRRRGGRAHGPEHERRHGGRTHESEHERHRAKGGRVRHHRAKGGEIGANERPLSTAAHTTRLKGEGPENYPSD